MYRSELLAQIMGEILMKLRVLLSAPVLLVFICSPAISQSCEKVNDTSMRGMRCNMMKESEAAKTEMDQALRAAIGVLEANSLTRGTVAVERLVRSQQAWLQATDDYCDVEGIATAGAIQPQLGLFAAECRMTHYKRRTEDLRAIREFAR